jgi:ElaB/YqjD/DUF883 family membrane-anchored ribosome-binding protein
MTTFQKMLAMHIINATPPSRHYVAAPWGGLAMAATIAFVIGFILGDLI